MVNLSGWRSWNFHKYLASSLAHSERFSKQSLYCYTARWAGNAAFIEVLHSGTASSGKPKISLLWLLSKLYSCRCPPRVTRYALFLIGSAAGTTYSQRCCLLCRPTKRTGAEAAIQIQSLFDPMGIAFSQTVVGRWKSVLLQSEWAYIESRCFPGKKVPPALLVNVSNDLKLTSARHDLQASKPT